MRFTAVLRAVSRPKVRRDDPPLVLLDSPTPIGPITLAFRTRYDEREFGIAVPRELWIEARGDAANLEEGLNEAWGASATVLPVIALTTNAAIGDVQPHLAFETSEGTDDRAFFQSTVETERGIPLPGRRVPIEATVATLEAVATTGRADPRDAIRLIRAAGQYAFALRYWKRHFELLSVSHLFMATEALKVVALRRELADIGLDEAQLAERWGIRPGEPRSRALLEAEARRRLVFQGDEETHKLAAEISDGFEHGYKDFGDLHGPSLRVRDRAGRLIRGSWLRLAGVSEDIQSELTSGRYEVPVDMTEYVRYMRGRLIGTADELAPDGEEYPYLEWTSAPRLQDAGEGRITISGEETFTVRTAEGIGFQAQSYEFWGPQMEKRPEDSAGTGRETEP